MKQYKQTFLNSWKNKKVFTEQLELNKTELKNYPPHWKVFVHFLKELKSKNVLDLGCGVGTMSELCINLNINYVGVDYAQEAIDIAKKEWPKQKWFVKDYKELDKSFCSSFDTLYAGAFLDVLPNGDEVFEFLLELGVPNVIIGRAKITDKESYYTTYTAYNEITTYAYHHNINNLIEAAKSKNYKLTIFGEPMCSTLIATKL